MQQNHCTVAVLNEMGQHRVQRTGQCLVNESERLRQCEECENSAGLITSDHLLQLGLHPWDNCTCRVVRLDFLQIQDAAKRIASGRQEFQQQAEHFR
jgi:hypothetical protein